MTIAGGQAAALVWTGTFSHNDVVTIPAQEGVAKGRGRRRWQPAPRAPLEAAPEERRGRRLWRHGRVGANGAPGQERAISTTLVSCRVTDPTSARQRRLRRRRAKAGTAARPVGRGANGYGPTASQGGAATSDRRLMVAAAEAGSVATIGGVGAPAGLEASGRAGRSTRGSALDQWGHRSPATVRTADAAWVMAVVAGLVPSWRVRWRRWLG